MTSARLKIVMGLHVDSFVWELKSITSTTVYPSLSYRFSAP